MQIIRPLQTFTVDIRPYNTKWQSSTDFISTRFLPPVDAHALWMHHECADERLTGKKKKKKLLNVLNKKNLDLFDKTI